MFGFNKKAFKELQNKLEEANRKLYEYMDITRSEAFESYRKGLNDGLDIKTRQRPLIVSNNPVKSAEEHKNDIVKAVNQDKEEQKTAQCLSNLFGYDGSKQEKVIE